MPHITQVAATEYETGQIFSTFIKPKKEISVEAAMVTGICGGPPGSLIYKGKQVPAPPCKDGMLRFLEWLGKWKSPIVLVAHNCRNFDSKVLTVALEGVDLLSDFTEKVAAFGDSLKLFRKKIPDQESYKQEDLVTKILQKSYNAHNAEGDVTALRELMRYTNVTPKDVAKFTFPSNECHLQNIFQKEKAKNITSFHPLIGQGVLKTSLAENIAGSGLSVKHLKLIYKRDKNDGLRYAFTAKNSSGRPRVTDHKKTLETVLPAMAKYFEEQE